MLHICTFVPKIIEKSLILEIVESILVREHFGPQLPFASVPAMVKSKTRSIDTVDDANFPVYNAGNRRGPPFSKICRGDINTNNGRRLEKELVVAFGAPSFK